MTVTWETWIKSHQEPGILQYYRDQTLDMWRKGQIRGEELPPRVQQYIIDHGLEGPRPRGIP